MSVNNEAHFCKCISYHSLIKSSEIKIEMNKTDLKMN